MLCWLMITWTLLNSILTLFFTKIQCQKRNSWDQIEALNYPRSNEKWCLSYQRSLVCSRKYFELFKLFCYGIIFQQLKKGFCCKTIYINSLIWVTDSTCTLTYFVLFPYMSLIFLPIFKTFYPETYIDITHSSFVHTIVFVWIKGLLLIERERERANNNIGFKKNTVWSSCRSISCHLTHSQREMQFYRNELSC